MGAGLHVALGEAKLVDFARMKFSAVAGPSPALESRLSGEVRLALPAASPWRYVMIGASPAQLLERNYLVLNLNDPPSIGDVSWIKPGKVIRDVTLTTQGGLACVDFAAARGLQYVEFDAGWYGPEDSESSSALAVDVDPRRSAGPLDLPRAHSVRREQAHRRHPVREPPRPRAPDRRHPPALPVMGGQRAQVRVRPGGIAAVDELAARSRAQGGGAPAHGGRARRVPPDGLRTDAIPT